MRAIGGAEIVYVDDGSTDDAAEQLTAAADQPGAQLIRRQHRRNYGQSAAVRTGVRAASGEWVATLDGDGQNDPADIPALLARAQEEEGAKHSPILVAGHRVIRRETFLELPRFDHMHRFLPALVLRAGGHVVSVPVRHRPRLWGHSNCGVLDRLWAGVFDLAGVYWLQRRWQRPEVEEP